LQESGGVAEEQLGRPERCGIIEGATVMIS
jgi:hypothetical protein